MDANFHYYVTYTSAREAGFSNIDALYIANASQFVDENFNVSTQSTGKMLWSNFIDAPEIIPEIRPELAEVARIWPVFHFLPGDFAQIVAEVAPALTASEEQLISDGVQLICTPESELVWEIVSATRTHYTGASGLMNKLVRIGITMHVLADTFAHQGFVGLPLGSVNEVKNVKCADDVEQFARVKWSPGFEIGDRRSYAPGFSETSFGYLGHGRMGHLPDEPGLSIIYSPQWLKPEHRNLGIFRSNPVEFYCAFVQMTEAMQYIRTGAPEFNQRLDRSIISDETEGLTEHVQNMLNIFINSESDANLPDYWLAHFGEISSPWDAKARNSDEVFKTAFNQEAENHRTVVLNNSPILSRLIEDLS